MKVVLSVNGVFHHFELARELARRDMLDRIYSTFHWGRLKREGLDRHYVRAFPWIHPAQLALQRLPIPVPTAVDTLVSRLVRTTLDGYVAGNLPECDAYVALSGSGLSSGQVAQQRGARWICDRGSSHIRYQNRIVSEEYELWKVDKPGVDPFFIRREEAEYAAADAITVPSLFSQRTFLEMGVPAEKLHRIPYGVLLDRFRRVGEPPKDSFEVLFAGSVGLRKGVPYLLQAFRMLQHPRKRLRIVGSVLPEMKDIFRSQDMSGIELVGRVPQTQMVEYMSTSHVMVLPSIEDGFGLVLGQALACGCPLISSTNTGGEDLFTEGIEGFMVPIRSPRAIADRLQQLADDPDLQQRMSEAALARVQHIGGWEQYGDAYASLLQKLTANTSVPTASV